VPIVSSISPKKTLTKPIVDGIIVQEKVQKKIQEKILKLQTQEAEIMRKINEKSQ